MKLILILALVASLSACATSATPSKGGKPNPGGGVGPERPGASDY